MLNYLDLCFDAQCLSLSLLLRNMANIGQHGMSAQYDVEKHHAHTHLAHRLPLWSASPFVRLMLINPRQRQTHTHTHAPSPGCLLMSLPFDSYRHQTNVLVLCLDLSVCVLSEEEEELGDKRSRLWGRSADEELFMVNREYVIFLSLSHFSLFCAQVSRDSPFSAR